MSGRIDTRPKKSTIISGGETRNGRISTFASNMYKRECVCESECVDVGKNCVKSGTRNITRKRFTVAADRLECSAANSIRC